MEEGASSQKQRKARLRVKLEKMLSTYTKVLIVFIDNVGSLQMQQIRKALRGTAGLLMGKNTLIRRVIRDAAAQHPKMQALLPQIRGNVGLVFTNGNLIDVRKTIEANVVPAAAKTGTFAPCDVIVPPGPTGLDPGQTAFFQALNIATKINKGSIEILNEVKLLMKGDRVSASAVSLLGKLNLRPFSYGMKVVMVCEEGSVFDPEILNMTDDILRGFFMRAVNTVAAISLQINLPTAASVPHSIVRGFKKLLAVAVSTEYSFPEAQKAKDYIANPSAFAGAAPVAAAAAPAASAAKEKEKEPEKEESDGGDMFGGGGLFD